MSDRPGPTDEADGFFARWSRRKSQIRQSQPAGEQASSTMPSKPLEADTEASVGAPSSSASSAQPLDSSAQPASTTEAIDKPPPLTLDDVEKLTPQSDFSVFARRDVEPSVRNAAMKKLFHAEPHFNVMDGLDVYIDDYNTPDPLPKAIMRTMLQARALGLLDDELKDQDKPEPDVQVSPLTQAHTAAPHENTDLQLQPDDAAGHAGAGTGALDDPDGTDAPAGFSGDEQRNGSSPDT